MLITLMTASNSLRQRWISVLAGVQNLFGAASDRYRPELHYMRGPGPKWRAKNTGEQSFL
jgi:hypothetical protein